MAVSRDYKKELGIPDHKKKLPRPIAIVVLAIVAVGVSFGVVGVISETKEFHAAEKAKTPAPAKPAAEPAK